ncbi:MAG: hypothetical protein WCS31_19150, partial [Verrucomicrobiae bacterium]
LGSAWCRHGKEILAADGLSPAMEKHSSRRSLSAGNVVFDDVHWFYLETTKAGTLLPRPLLDVGQILTP